MLGDQFRHAFKTEVWFHRFLDRGGRAATAPCTSVNPCRRQADCLGRHVVVEKALRDVQDTSGVAAEVSSHPGEQEFKIGQRRFVRADLLGGKDRIPRIGGSARREQSGCSASQMPVSQSIRVP